MKPINRQLARISTAAIALLSLVQFAWPLLIGPQGAEQAQLAQSTFLVLMPVLIALMLVSLGSGSLTSRQVAVLAVLIALNAVVRMLGAGTAGIETVFFLILIGGYALGASFGYLLGTGSLLVSALLTGGFGPWLPFQMMAAGLIGLAAGLLPHPGSRKLQLLWLSCLALVGSYAYGALMTLWNWPYLAGAGGTLGYIGGAPLAVNLGRFIGFEFVTGGLLWDTGRAVTTLILLWLTAPALLSTLGRVANRAGFESSEART